jgi:succinoglycan biosynthesis transport protein ExoP
VARIRTITRRDFNIRRYSKLRLRHAFSFFGELSTEIPQRSYSEFQRHFSENVVGQIPKEKVKGRMALLQPNDPRHIFAESHRNIRSSLLFMPYEGPRPKTIFVTSAVPNEGKSTVSANLAIALALSGARTLLIDGDLRRSTLREQFGGDSRLRFSEILHQEVPWQEVVMPTTYSSLFLLTRGKALPQPSEHLLRDSTDQFLQEIYHQFDYIIIDSSPVLCCR